MQREQQASQQQKPDRCGYPEFGKWEAERLNVAQVDVETHAAVEDEKWDKVARLEDLSCKKCDVEVDVSGTQDSRGDVYSLFLLGVVLIRETRDRCG